MNRFVGAENRARKELGMPPVDPPQLGGHHALYTKLQLKRAAVFNAHLAGANVAEIAVGHVGHPAPMKAREGHPAGPSTDGSHVVSERTDTAFAARASRTTQASAALSETSRALHAGTRALGAASRVPGPIGLAIDAQTLNEAFHADGSHLGDQTARAASGIAGGWGGAIAGAETGAAVGAAAGSVVPGIGTAAGAAIGGTAGAVAGGITGDRVGRCLFDRVKTMFGSTQGDEPLTLQARPDAAPATHATAGLPSTSSDRIAGIPPDTSAAAP